MRLGAWMGLAALLFCHRAAAATDKADTDKSEKKADESGDQSFGHGRQFGLRAGIVGGYRMIFRYDKSPFCADYDPKKSIKDQQKFCGHAAPFATELALSFAPLDSVEPFLFARLGLSSEKETDT